MDKKKKEKRKVLQLTIMIMGPELVICSIVATDSGAQPSVCNKQCSVQLSGTVTHTVFTDTVTHTVFNDTVFNDSHTHSVQ